MSLVIRAKPYPPTPRNRVRPPISGSGNGEQERGMFSPQTASQEDRAAGGNIIDNERDEVVSRILSFGTLLLMIMVISSVIFVLQCYIILYTYTYYQ